MDSSPSSKDAGQHQSTGFGLVTEVGKGRERDRETSPWKITAVKSGKGWATMKAEEEFQTFSE